MNQIVQGNVMDVLRGFPDESVHCVITSPPYWGLRRYSTEPVVWDGDPACAHEWGEALEKSGGGGQPGEKVRWQHEGQGPSGHPRADAGNFCRCGAWKGHLGLEPTIDLYVRHLTDIFREVRRVLRKDGTAWINLGDCFATGAGRVGERPGGGAQGDRWASDSDNKGNRGSGHGMGPMTQPNRMPQDGLKQKNLVGMPWRVAFALQADGWILRSEITWCKSAPMPESVEDRPTSATEKVFLFSKSQKYFYDSFAVREPASESSLKRIAQATFDTQTGGPKDYSNGTNPSRSARKTLENFAANPGRNMRNYWILNPEPFPDAHFAVYPTKLVAPCILAGTSERGCCDKCGAPMRRVVQPSKEYKKHLGKGFHEHGNDGERGMMQEKREGFKTVSSEYVSEGWAPTCGCGGSALEPDDLELIESPLGSVQAPDPSMETGRAGYNRPRSEDGGKTSMTRWEQREIARQLRESPNRAEMEEEAGKEAFAHYIRTDRSGARAVPVGLLDKWEVLYGIERDEPPMKAPPLVPGVVLDPFMGAGTTALVALKGGRHFVGIELSGEYAELARKRIAPELVQGRIF